MRLQVVLLFAVLSSAAMEPAAFQAKAAKAQEPESQKEKPAARTDFSGRWRMDKQKSDFGTFRKPDLVVRAIDQHGPDMNVHLVQTTGDRTSTVDVTYKIDGTYATNVVNGRDARSKSFWDGRDLVVRTNMKNSKNEDEVIEDRYSLSADGKTLTTTSHVLTDKGEATLVMVSHKETADG